MEKIAVICDATKYDNGYPLQISFRIDIGLENRIIGGLFHGRQTKTYHVGFTDVEGGFGHVLPAKFIPGNLSSLDGNLVIEPDWCEYIKINKSKKLPQIIRNLVMEHIDYFNFENGSKKPGPSILLVDISTEIR